MQSNEVIDKLPCHLYSLIIDQPYNNYTAQDHAVWRYIMRQNVRYLPDVAHSSYLKGLKRTGISINRIPRMYGMNRILKEIGWAAVAVDGFIPPAAFMEFQSYNVLVIASDIRPIDQILYTPAPDIIHEAAGHAPIIADEEYAAYLRDFGRAGSKAFSSVYDTRMYEAIRHLSILKADPYTSADDIGNAEAELDSLSGLQEAPSEMALLRNLHWWTVEYGLIGKVENPRIYGAGLLSSIGESHNCLKPHIKKIPYSLEAQNFSFDITTQQPQLFVTPDFKQLHSVLDQFVDSMAVRHGGLESLNKALRSEATCTVVYNSGLQVSGKLVKIYEDKHEPAYLVFEGLSMLSFNNRLLKGHGTLYHNDGFGSPVGAINEICGNIVAMSEGELISAGISAGEDLTLNFNSGVQVKGKLEKVTRFSGKNLLFSFQNCTVSYRNELLFKPEWGIYDMAIGEEIISAFSGPADPEAFGLRYPAPLEKTHHFQHSENTKKLHKLYHEVQILRKKKDTGTLAAEIWKTLKINYPAEWLLPLEIAEILSRQQDTTGILNDILSFLKNRSAENDQMRNLIEDGLELISSR